MKLDALLARIDAELGPDPHRPEAVLEAVFGDECPQDQQRFAAEATCGCGRGLSDDAQWAAWDECVRAREDHERVDLAAFDAHDFDEENQAYRCGLQAKPLPEFWGYLAEEYELGLTLGQQIAWQP